MVILRGTPTHSHLHAHTHLTTHKSSIAAGLTGTPTRSKVALADCGTFQGRFKCLLGTLLCVSFNFLGLSLVGTHFYFQHRQLMAQNCSTYCCSPSPSLSLSPCVFGLCLARTSACFRLSRRFDLILNLLTPLGILWLPTWHQTISCRLPST